MKFSAVIIPKNKQHNELKLFPASLFLSSCAVLSGLVCGTLLYCFTKETVFDSVFSLFVSFFSDFSQKSNSEIISGLILSELPYICMMFLLGMSVIGYPFTLILSFIKSLAPTLLFAHLYSEYGLKGAEYVFLVLSLGEIVSIFGVLLLTQSSFSMSRALKRQLMGEKGEYTEETKAYILKFSISAGIIILSCFISFFTITSFSSLFTF